MRLEYRMFSDCGPRWKNEDFLDAVELPDRDRAMFIVCDGMGGQRSGDIASGTVVKSICKYWRGNPKRHDSEKKITDAADQAQIALEKRPQVKMGTTMVMAAIEGRRVFIAHCGDSRAYLRLQSSGGVVWHTQDHVERNPEGWEIVAKGFVQGERCHEPEMHAYDIAPGDVILLCSDGLYKAFGDHDIDVLLGVGLDIDALAGKLKEHCAVKSRDNYSAIVIMAS